jgi:chromosome segregation ATPase
MTEILNILDGIRDNNLALVFVLLIFGWFFFSILHYLNADNIEDQIDRSVRVPSLLVSLGMLGTFVGILVSLSNFSINSGGISRASSIDAFIEGMFIAFTSSVVGLFFSLVFRIFVEVRHKKIDQNDEGEATVKDLLVKMTEVKDAISKDDDSSLLYQTKSMRSDMNDKLRDLQKSFDQFKNEMAENNIKALVEAVNKVMEDFNAKINDKLGETFERLNSSVEQLVKWQDEYRNYLEEAKRRLEEAKDGINKVASNLENISHSMESLPEKAQKIEDIVINLGNQINELEDRLAAFKDMREKAINAMPEIEKNLENLTSNFETSVDNVLKDIQNSSNEMKISLEHQTENMTKLTQDISLTLSQSSNEMSSSIQKSINTSTSEIKKSVEQQKSDMTKLVDSVSSDLSNASGELAENINAHLKSIESLGDDIKETTNQSIKDLNDRMIEQVSEIDRNIQETHKNVIESMGSKLTALSEKFVDDYTPLTEKLRDLVKISENRNQ